MDEPEEADEEAEEEQAEEDEGWDFCLTKADLKQEVLKILEGANMDEFNLKSLMKQLGVLHPLQCHWPCPSICSFWWKFCHKPLLLLGQDKG